MTDRLTRPNARRVWRDLLADGVECGLHRVERLIRLQALRARPRAGGRYGIRRKLSASMRT
jgi:hypothetical protein